MFFFFIAGIQPRSVTLDKQPRLCPVCGLNRATLKRMDHYFSLFFIPLFRVKKGEPFLECPSCGPVTEKAGPPLPPIEKKEYPSKCPSCGREVLPEYRFCPFCGKKINKGV